MGDIIGFDKKEKLGDASARCLECGHEWGAERESGDRDIECPKCNTLKGVFIRLVTPDEHWRCFCGCDLFFVTKEYFVCSLCGEYQVFE